MGLSLGGIGGAISGVGGLLDGFNASANARDAGRAATFNPGRVSGPAGTASFFVNTRGNAGSRSIDANFNPSGNLRDLLSGVQTQGLAGLGDISPQGLGIQNAAISQVPGTFDNLQSFLANAPGPQFSTQGAIGQQQLGDVSSNLQNQQLLGGLVNPALQSFGRASQGAFDLAGQQQGVGTGLLNQQVGNFDDIAAQTTANLRAGAQPGNERAAASLADRLFSGGQLGSTGGANQFGRLQEAQDQQDLGFQNAGFNQATALRGQDINRVLGQQGIGSNLLAGSGQNISSGGNLLGAGLNSALNLTQGQLPFQQNTAGVGQQFTDQSVQGFGIENSRANQLFGNATNLFGFGAGVQNQGLNTGIQALGATGGVQDIANNTIALGANIGGINAQAGNNVGTFMQSRGSGAGQTLGAIGGFMSGLGNPASNFLT